MLSNDDKAELRRLLVAYRAAEEESLSEASKVYEQLDAFLSPLFGARWFRTHTVEDLERLCELPLQ